MLDPIYEFEKAYVPDDLLFEAPCSIKITKPVRCSDSAGPNLLKTSRPVITDQFFLAQTMGDDSVGTEWYESNHFDCSGVSSSVKTKSSSGEDVVEQRSKNKCANAAGKWDEVARSTVRKFNGEYITKVIFTSCIPLVAGKVGGKTYISYRYAGPWAKK